MKWPLRLTPWLVKTSLLATLLLFVLGTFNVATANFTPLPTLPEPIHIRSDGTLDPPQYPIARSGDTYTFADNLNLTLVVERDNIVLDGNGFTLNEPPVDTQALMIPLGWNPGIYLANRNNVTIQNVTVASCITGISVENSSNVDLINCTLTHNSDALYLSGSCNVTVVQCRITENSGTGIMFFLQCTNGNVTENNISSNSKGIQLAFTGSFPQAQTTNTLIADNNIISNSRGIDIAAGTNNTIIDNTIAYNHLGINILSAGDNLIYYNNFESNIQSGSSLTDGSSAATVNHWDNGTVGNYWSDCNGADQNHDGRGDTPYILQQQTNHTIQGYTVTVGINEQDNFPLMAPIDFQNPRPLPTPTPNVVVTPDALSPAVPELHSWLILYLAVALLGVALAFKKKMGAFR